MINSHTSGKRWRLPVGLPRGLGIGVVCLDLLVLLYAIDQTRAAEPLPAGYTIPVVDISSDENRQVIVDREPGQYLVSDQA